MKTYREYSPTPLDTKGLALDDQQDWLVVVGQNRDSNALDRSNFRVILKDIGGEGDDVEVHRFGHWACGWLEIVIVRPDTDAARKAQSWEEALSNYPVASDDDYGALEHEEVCRAWENMSIRERMRLCKDKGVSIFSARRDELPDSDAVFESLRD